MNEADKAELEFYRALARARAEEKRAEEKRKSDALLQRPDEPDHQYKARIGTTARHAMPKIVCGLCQANVRMRRDFASPEHRQPGRGSVCPRSGEDLFELALGWYAMVAPENGVKP